MADGEYIGKLKIVKAIEVTVSNDEDGDDDTKRIQFKYDIVDYDSNNLYLQFYFNDPN